MTNGATVLEPTPISGSLTSGGPVNGAGRPFVPDASTTARRWQVLIAKAPAPGRMARPDVDS
jgi:hypothetical protein